MSDQRLVRRQLSPENVGGRPLALPASGRPLDGRQKPNLDESGPIARWTPSENLAGWPAGWLVRIQGRL
jgi:hypothetical protein